MLGAKQHNIEPNDKARVHNGDMPLHKTLPYALEKFLLIHSILTIILFAFIWYLLCRDTLQETQFNIVH